MSANVETHFAQQFTQGVYHLAQQKGSRLRSAVDTVSGIRGDRVFFDQLDKVSANRLEGRHEDTQYTEVPHKRYMLTLRSYVIAELVNDIDKLKTLNDPTNEYAKAFANAMGRAIDDEIIAAMYGPRYTGVDGTTTEAWARASDTGQIVGTISGGDTTGLTVTKLVKAKRIFMANEEDTDGLSIVCSARQIQDLLGETEIKSYDYNSVKALVRGEVDTFMGFKFIQSERLPADGNDRRVFAFHKSAIKLAIGMDVMGKIEQIPTKNYETQVYYKMHIGATRTRNTGIVEIQCHEG